MPNTEEYLDDEVKGPDQVQLDQDIGCDQSCQKLYKTRGGQNKDLSQVPAGPEVAQNSPGVTKMDKKKAYEELIRMGGETPEE
ncbi:hypothetical protein N7481_010180 [Penicillium waksmanii]|uniref:uncharacterized protein n=1 Tax=Penicillium waksmanii TaxID=69791 RepID=UPI0025469E06|nr:uncharacterized protein N7481_010180 [Penicillium waksmanii]KAJ5976473.1 hypothetical protein N7481_010180 [Penicillium waksmanii]